MVGVSLFSPQQPQAANGGSQNPTSMMAVGMQSGSLHNPLHTQQPRLPNGLGDGLGSEVTTVTVHGGVRTLAEVAV